VRILILVESNGQERKHAIRIAGYWLAAASLASLALGALAVDRAWSFVFSG
jgi:hypothetical protein